MSRLYERDLCKGGAAPAVTLTLHQPLASFMVYGLKRVEGRGWSSAVRGTLWIHAAAKEPSPEDIEQGEAFYREVHRLDGDGSPLQLPKHYPVSCLVGKVEVVDVVEADTFLAWDSLPDGARLEGEANGAGYYFLCEKQQRLVMPIEMKGQHKLWRLPKKVASEVAVGLRDCEQMQINFVGHRDASGVGGGRQGRGGGGGGGGSGSGNGGGGGGGGGGRGQRGQRAQAQQGQSPPPGFDGNQSRGGAAAAAAAAAAVPNLPTSWACEICTLINDPGAQLCSACGIGCAPLPLPLPGPPPGALGGYGAYGGVLAAAAGTGGAEATEAAAVAALAAVAAVGEEEKRAASEPRPPPPLTAAQREKRVKALRKKQRQAEALEAKRRGGVELNVDQREKVARIPELTEELARLLSLS
jgi:hypothetical protein